MPARYYGEPAGSNDQVSVITAGATRLVLAAQADPSIFDFGTCTNAKTSFERALVAKVVGPPP